MCENSNRPSTHVSTSNSYRKCLGQKAETHISYLTRRLKYSILVSGMAPNALIEQSTIFLFLTSPELIYCHNLINGNNVCDQRLLCAAQHSRMQYEKLNYFICNNNDNNGELKYQNTQLSAAAGFISYSRMHLKWEVACHFPLFLRRGAEAKGALYSVPVVRACVLFAPLLSRWRVCERRH